MVKIAERVGRLAPFLFVELNKVIREQQAKGVDVITLGVGNPDLPPPPHVVDRLCEVAHTPTGHLYPESPGYRCPVGPCATSQSQSTTCRGGGWSGFSTPSVITSTPLGGCSRITLFSSTNRKQREATRTLGDLRRSAPRGARGRMCFGWRPAGAAAPVFVVRTAGFWAGVGVPSRYASTFSTGHLNPPPIRSQVVHGVGREEHVVDFREGASVEQRLLHNRVEGRRRQLWQRAPRSRPARWVITARAVLIR